MSVKPELAYSRWVTIKIINNHKTRVIKIKNASLNHGKFHKKDNKDAEIPASEINDKVIQPGNSFTIYSCGRSYAIYGTEGHFDLVEETTNKLIRTFHWDCPQNIAQKRVELKGNNPDWAVSTSGFLFGPRHWQSDNLGNGKVICEEGLSLSIF